MGYELMGRAHVALAGLREQRGQGTVEYVGLILLLAVVLAAAVAATKGDQSIGKTIVEKVKGAIEKVGEGS
jgi:Flp pilus assembly pilin Flp